MLPIQYRVNRLFMGCSSPVVAGRVSERLLKLADATFEAWGDAGRRGLIVKSATLKARGKMFEALAGALTLKANAVRASLPERLDYWREAHGELRSAEQIASGDYYVDGYAREHLMVHPRGWRRSESREPLDMTPVAKMPAY